MLAVTALLLVSGSCLCAPVPEADTAYGRSAFRLEYRPGPSEVADDAARRKLEADWATAFDARWISVIDPAGNPLFPNTAVPAPDPRAGDYDAILRKWVDDIHSHGLPAMSWYPLVADHAAGVAHPEWRQVSLIPNPDGPELFCCINSGYGDAVIDICNQAIERYGLDGIWFDGSSWSNIWRRPIPTSCFCDSCRRKFRADTGLDLPAKEDWTDPTFRRWVAWRYKTFGEYIGRLTAAIRARHPKAAVVVNHYHRPQIPWQGAIPLDLYDADIITGSEAGQASADIIMRLCRAYRRPQSEVWRPFDAGADPEKSTQTNELLHHALSCFCAGGLPSFGYGDTDRAGAAATARLIAPVIKAIRPYANLPSLPHIALHVSQQTETFHFARDTGTGAAWATEPFFATLSQWTEALNRAHMPADYVFDKALTAAGLEGYRVLLMPESLGLTDVQARTVLDFARGGGLVVLGPGTGQLDEWGERAAHNTLAHALDIGFGPVPAPDADDQVLLDLVGPHGVTRKIGGHRIAVALGSGWEVLYRHADSTVPAIATRPFGKGRVIALDLDFTTAPTAWFPADGGDTSITATTETAAGGTRSLLFVDGPDAPHPWYPDMEMRFPAITSAHATAIRLGVDLRIDGGAGTQIELRDGGYGVTVAISADGKLTDGGHVLAQVPLKQWFHLALLARFATEAAPATHDVTVTQHGADPQRFAALATPNAAWNLCDWAVIYGPGQAAGRFFVDNLLIESVAPSGALRTVLHEDAEGPLPGGTDAAAPDPFALLDDILTRYAPPPIRVTAPTTTRVGFFRSGKDVVVHAYDTAAPWQNWSQAGHGKIVLEGAFPLSSADLSLRGKPLPIVRQGNKWRVEAPVALYEVLTLRAN